MGKCKKRPIWYEYVAVVLVAITISVQCLFGFSSFNNLVMADGEALVDIHSEINEDECNPGDIISIDITATNLSHIVRFGPITISYDPNTLDYHSISQSTEMSAFTFDVDVSEPGTIIVSAVNESVVADIEAAVTQGGEFEDNSFSSEDEVILFSLAFRVLPASSGETIVEISDIGEFIDSSSEVSQVVINNGFISTTILAEASSDAQLAFLTTNGYTLTPEFSPQITEYTISIGRDIMSVQISAIPVNLWATVQIYGNSNLQEGDNIISIEVLAQDGVTHNTYTIHATKQETYLTEGSGLLDYEGRIYTFVALPSDFEVPEGFIETNRTINGYSVPVLAKDGVESLLVYVSDGSNSPAFYFYNPTNKTVVPYKPVSTEIISSRILFRVDVPEKVKIPEGFSPSTLYVKGTEIEGYANSNGDYICYMLDENNNGGFYRYNVETSSFTEYVAPDKGGSQIYRFFFHLFLFATAVEAIIIVTIVFIIRQNIIKRRNPRPKRV